MAIYDHNHLDSVYDLSIGSLPEHLSVISQVNGNHDSLAFRIAEPQGHLYISGKIFSAISMVEQGYLQVNQESLLADSSSFG